MSNEEEVEVEVEDTLLDVENREDCDIAAASWALWTVLINIHQIRV